MEKKPRGVDFLLWASADELQQLRVVETFIEWAVIVATNTELDELRIGMSQLHTHLPSFVKGLSLQLETHANPNSYKLIDAFCPAVTLWDHVNGDEKCERFTLIFYLFSELRPVRRERIEKAQKKARLAGVFTGVNSEEHLLRITEETLRAMGSLK